MILDQSTIRRVRATLAVVAALLAGPASLAETPAGVELEGPAAPTIFARIQATLPTIPIVAIRPSGAEGLYAVEIDGAGAYYATEDGMHLVAGDLYSLGGASVVNLTEQVRSSRREQIIDELDPEGMIVFAPEGETLGVVNVFTDVDCGFCQRLHREVPAMNAHGIEVRYLAYPRAGVTSPSGNKLVNAWCADDPQDALTRLKNGQPVEPRYCENPIAEHYRLGRVLGVRGTPALFLADGTHIPGYRTADVLASEMGLLAAPDAGGD